MKEQEECLNAFHGYKGTNFYSQMTLIYLEFLRYCLDDRLPLPERAKDIDWMQMMAWAEQQAIVGVIYGGMQRARMALVCLLTCLWSG